ncbi:hypothetical protein QNI16_34790 [Cytophagaceae bacterium YF14B1]|uniref:Uncharacterized protein n=1 Tax=Xanthocytophaga flava TaxID=3048013 RepID=A0AAE3QUG7_9BACT|nr:hypothetical protein [Xanthocytophaga flavus]MDJ1485700.1 hypothetical protein [Xanthocytophaga flavus]
MNQVLTSPVDEKIEAAFSAESNPKTISEPVKATSTTTFKMGLFSNGVQLGWMGQTDSGWAVLVTDESKAIRLEQYPYNGVTYFRIATDTSRYMSVSNNSYIGFYNWLSATGFTLKGSHLVANYNGQQLSLYSTDNAYLYAWDAYTVLEVKFI